MGSNVDCALVRKQVKFWMERSWCGFSEDGLSFSSKQAAEYDIIDDWWVADEVEVRRAQRRRQLSTPTNWLSCRGGR